MVDAQTIPDQTRWHQISLALTLDDVIYNWAIVDPGKWSFMHLIFRSMGHCVTRIWHLAFAFDISYHISETRFEPSKLSFIYPTVLRSMGRRELNLTFSICFWSLLPYLWDIVDPSKLSFIYPTVLRSMGHCETKTWQLILLLISSTIWQITVLESWLVSLHYNTWWWWWWWWLIAHRRGLLGRLMVNSCMLVACW